MWNVTLQVEKPGQKRLLRTEAREAQFKQKRPSCRNMPAVGDILELVSSKKWIHLVRLHLSSLGEKIL